MENEVWCGAGMYELLGKDYKRVSIGWWVFWLVLFWPALIIVLVVHTSTIYTVSLSYPGKGSRIVTLDNVDYYKLQATVRQKTAT